MSLISRLHHVLEGSVKDRFVELRTSTSMEELRRVANLEDIPLERLKFVERLEDGEYGLLDMEENIFYRTTKDVERGFETYSGTIMTFEDPEIKKWLVANIGGERGITNGAYGKVGVRGIAGEVTYEQVLATEDVSIPRSSTIRRFNELVYFKNLKRFTFSSSSIEEISLPYMSIDVSSPFYVCTRLRKLTTKYGLDVRSDAFFRGCNSLVNLDTSNWTFSGSSIERMFEGCRSLTRLDLRNLDVGNVSVATNMFTSCSNLREVLVDGWNLERLSVAESMFSGCSSLQSLDTSKWNLGNLSNGASMFSGCSSLQSLDTSKWNLGNLSIGASMFSGCSSLQSLDTSKWNLGNLSNGQSMFSGCSSLQSLDTSKWNLGNLSNGQSMFSGCSSLQSLDTSKWNLGNLNTAENMFRQTKINTLDVRGWDLRKLTNAVYMFFQTPLISLDTSGWVLNNLSNAAQMFKLCSNLITLGNTSGWGLEKLTNASAMFNGCSALQSLDTSGWRLENVVSANLMFDACMALTSLGDTSGWNLIRCTDMRQMILRCNRLTKIDLTYTSTPLVVVNNLGNIFLEDDLESIVGDHTETDNVSVFNGFTETAGSSISIAHLTSLNLASILAIIRGLGTNRTRRRLTLPQSIDKSRIPQEYKTMLVNKNWELA